MNSIFVLAFCLTAVLAGKCVDSIIFFNDLSKYIYQSLCFCFFSFILACSSIRNSTTAPWSVSFIFIEIFRFFKSIFFLKNSSSIFGWFKRNHYAQHQQSVQLARQGQSARLESFGTSNTQQTVPSDDICGLCERYEIKPVVLSRHSLINCVASVMKFRILCKVIRFFSYYHYFLSLLWMCNSDSNNSV